MEEKAPLLQLIGELTLITSTKLKKLANQKVHVDDKIWLRDARYGGQRAEVLATKGVPGLDKIRVRLESDGSVIEVRRTDAVLLSKEELAENPYDYKPTKAAQAPESANAKFVDTESNDRRERDEGDKHEKKRMKHDSRRRDSSDDLRERDTKKEKEKGRDREKRNSKDSYRDQDEYHRKDSDKYKQSVLDDTEKEIERNRKRPNERDDEQGQSSEAVTGHTK
jgi:hypothetical protein